jgi:hypothetical protein
MSSLKQLDLPIAASSSKRKMEMKDTPARKYAATTQAPGYPSAMNGNVVGFRAEPAVAVGGRQVKRAHAPPAVKKGLRSIGKAVVKAGASVGNDALGVLTQTSSQMAAQAPDKLTQMAMSGGKERKPSPWIAHVKAYAAQHGLSYKDAMSQAKSTYKR